MLFWHVGGAPCTAVLTHRHRHSHPHPIAFHDERQAPAPLAYSNLVLRTAQYNEVVWEDVLKVLIGETRLIDSVGGPQVRWRWME